MTSSLGVWHCATRFWPRFWRARRPATTWPRASTGRWRTSGWRPRSSCTASSTAWSREGLIEARLVRQERRPNKRLFSLTEAGLGALRDFTAELPKPTAIRDELLVKVQAVDAGDEEAVRAAIAERLEWARAKLARYERLRDRLLDGRDEEEFLAGSERVGPYLTLMRGRSFEEENIRWGERALRVLEQRAAVRHQAGPLDVL